MRSRSSCEVDPHCRALPWSVAIGRAQLRTQHGQALVEMLVSLIVLVPLAASVMLLGQYIHIKQVTQGVARQAAWAATVSPALATQQIPDKGQVQSRLQARRFGSASTAISSQGRAPAKFASPMLTTFAGNPLLEPGDLTLEVYQQEASPSYVDQAVDIVGNVAGAVGLGDNFPPNRHGLVTAEVHARTRPITGRDGRVLDFLGDWAARRLDFSAHSVLLADSWSASGGGEKLDGTFDEGAAYANRTVRGVIRPLVPSEWIPGGNKLIGKAAHILGKIPLMNVFITAGMDKFEPGRAAPDIVPSDKLVKYKNVH